MNTERPDPHRPGGTLTAAGALLAVAACCAGPALVAGGALGAIGGLLRNPVVIAAGALILTAALGYAARVLRRRDPGSPDACCPPLDQRPESSIAPDSDRLEHPAASKDAPLNSGSELHCCDTAAVHPASLPDQRTAAPPPSGRD